MNVIEVDRLTKDYGHGRGIFDVTFEVHKGETLGFLGPNGAGKSTTMRHLMGFSRPHSGRAEIGGMDCSSKHHEILKNIGYLPGEVALPDGLTGRDFIEMMQNMRGTKDNGRTEELLKLFRMDPGGNVKRMSIGEKRKLAIVTAFMSDPDILLLDEPTSGLDPVMRDALIELILEQKRRGATVFMSSHIFKELEDTCDRVAFIRNGKLIDTVGRDVYAEDMPKLYRVGFAEESQYNEFISRTKFQIESSNDKYNHLVAAVPMGEINGFIRELSDYDMRYMRYVPYSLEMYYRKFIENGGNI